MRKQRGDDRRAAPPQTVDLQSVDLAAKLERFEETWAPKIVADYNGDEIMVAKFQGAFPFHVHEDTDDLFLVLKGRIRIELEGPEFPNGRAAHDVEEGQLFIVPKGVRHRPVAEQEAHVLLIEPAGTPNTGDAATAVQKDRI